MGNPKKLKYIKEFNTSVCSLPPVSVTFITPNIRSFTQQGSILMGDKTIYDDPRKKQGEGVTPIQSSR